MTVTVYSTLSSPVSYNIFLPKRTDKDRNTITQKIVIKGGANIADKNIYTPKGVVTHVEDDVFAILKEHPIFLRHEKAGFLKYDSGAHNQIEKAIKNLNKKDKSSPKTPDDYKEDSQPILNQA